MTKIDVISGFLGAGKTTLISKLFTDVLKGQKIVLIENEFGEIGIDGGFLQEAGVQINEINSGCICCTLKGDFEKALQQVIDTYHPDRIVIEPSGVGKLSDVLKAVLTIPGLEISSYSTVVDAPRCAIYHKNFKEFFDDQIMNAACVILSKTQKTSQEKIEEALRIIHELNPEARVITTAWDELTGQAIFDAMTGSTDGYPEEEEHECCCGHHHEAEYCCGDECDCGCEDEYEEECDCCCGEHAHHHHEEEHECCCGNHEHHYHEEEHECCCGHHEHHHHEEEHECCCGHHEHHHHADEIFENIGIQTVRKFSIEDLENALSKLGENIIRAKGIVQADDSGWYFFDYVPGDMDIRPGTAAYTGLITVIGEHINKEEIKQIFGVK